MKSLTVFRHGKASRSEKYPVDFDRPLTKRGPKDVAISVRVLLRLSPEIDWIISSPARRTRQTAEILHDSMGLRRGIIWEEDLYESGTDNALSIVQQVPNEVQHVLLVGHNPTMEEIISGICVGTTNHFSCSLSTSGFATMECEVMRWEQMRWGCGTLYQLVRPRMLKNL